MTNTFSHKVANAWFAAIDLSQLALTFASLDPLSRGTSEYIRCVCGVSVSASIHWARRDGGDVSSAGACRKAQKRADRLELVQLEHERVVSSAYFSHVTGNSVLTTCQDNRVRIWDQPGRLGGPASREMVHSHDFNRYLTPFRAVWDPKDPRERLFMIGRCALLVECYMW